MKDIPVHLNVEIIIASVLSADSARGKKDRILIEWVLKTVRGVSP